MKRDVEIRTVVIMGVLAGLLFAADGCGTHETIDARDATGRLGFQVKPAGTGAVVTVDGQQIGPARAYDGKSRVLEVAAGAHDVLIEAPGYQPFRTKVYLSDTTEIIRVVLTAR